MIWLMLINILTITEICQSFTINQQSFYNNGRYFNPRRIRDEVTTETSGTNTTQKARTNKETNYSKSNDSVIKYGLRKTPKFSKNKNINESLIINGSSNSGVIKNSKISQPLKSPSKSLLLSKALPSYKSDMLSKILSQSQLPVLTYTRPVSSNIYPVQYQYHHPLYSLQQETTIASVNRDSNTEPVTAATLNIDILHLPKESVKLEYSIPQPSINYNNKVYHNVSDKGIENQSYTPHHSYFIRKERNLNENHYDDDKLIEHNFNETRDDNKNSENDVRTTASSLIEKQPSLPSHEIRYSHDIFLNYPKSHHVNYGHIELSPYLFEKRFESLKAGNRYKGEVIWLDNDGGYTQHYWDMAQGKL